MTDDDKLIDKEGNVDEEELDRRIRELGLDASPTDNAKAEADKIDDEFAARLQALEDKARKQKLIRENTARETQRRQNSDASGTRGLGIGLSVAYTIIGMPLFGVAVGWFLDERSGTLIYRNLGVLIGSVLGIVGAIVILSRANRQE